MIKLIITDMDGTLLNDKHKINNEFWEIFKKLNKKGIVFAVASGRQYYNLLKNFKAIKDDIYFISENGASIIYKNREIFFNYIASNNITEIITESKKLKNCNIILCGKKSAYVENNNSKFISEVKKYYENYKIVQNLLEIKDKIFKITFYNFNGIEKNDYTYFIKNNHKYKISFSGNFWIDIVNNNVNKGIAVKKIQKLLNIKPKETMVFGNYLNDIEMLNNNYYSYAMENSHPKLTKYTNFKTKSNNENGVVDKIKEMLL